MTLWMLVLAAAWGGELSGVTLPDQVTVSGKTLVLNGMGVRQKYLFDVYVGALYLPSKTTDAAKAIDSDVAKRLVMHFVYSNVPADKVRETFTTGFAGVGAQGMEQKVAQLNGWMEDLTAGQEVVFDYVPGAGTTVTVKGAKKGTIAGADFMKALWGVYLGPSPPTSKLKTGLLGQ